MNLIAEHAEITKPGLYYHFDSKQALLASIANHAMDHLEKASREASLAAKSNEERLYRIVEAHARMITEEEEGAFTLLVIDLADKLPEADRRLLDHRKRAYFELVRGTLEQLRREGKLRPEVDETVAAFTLLGMVMWLTKWFRPDGRLGHEQVVEKIAQMALASVLLDEHRTF
jgi:AcrR family transcriptional regulator